MYLLYPGWDRKYPSIRKSFNVKYASVKNGQQKNDQLPANMAEEIPWNKLCVDLIGTYKIRRKGRDYLILKAVTMIDPVTGWFEIKQYNDKKSMVIINLV